MGVQTIDRLSERVSGDVITPSDAGYDEARKVFNAMIDRRPSVVVRCTSTDDVVAAVNFARENELDLAVRGGGHSVPGFGTADDAVVIDLSGMTRGAGRSRGADGARPGRRDVGHVQRRDARSRPRDDRAASSRRPASAGSRSAAASATSRAASGLSCDNLVSAEVVTADGRVLTASEAENDDLFWALRGGGGNFGVVTSFEFRLHPVTDIYGGPMFFDAEDAGTVLRAYREFIADAPEQFGGFPAWQIAPPLPFIPEERHGETMLAFVACWAGPVDEGEARPRADPRCGAGRGRARRPDAVPGAQQRLRRALSARRAAALLEGELRQAS